MIFRRLSFAALGFFVAAVWEQAVSSQESGAAGTVVVPGVAQEAEPVLRGPVHEAFAAPTQLNPQPSVVVPRKPPEPIAEIPPEVQPTEAGALWIPGYWAWDDERGDFLWVSGVWRVAPPDRRWVPGYWQEASGGHQWIAGFWAEVDAPAVAYQPYPPANLDIGANGPAPGDDAYWNSGMWIYRDSRYYWRPGCWITVRGDWMWQPAHYVWTPRGVVFVAGYWDYPLLGRGQIFAPVHIRDRAYFRPGRYYSPCVVLDIAHLVYHLFVRPVACHYYWGDFYGPRYLDRGWYPWVDYHGRSGCDPLFAYYRADYRRRGMDFERHMRDWHQDVVRHETRRPPHTLPDLDRMLRTANRDAERHHLAVARPAADWKSQRDGAERFTSISVQQREAWASRSRDFQRLIQERHDVESRSVAGGATHLSRSGDRVSRRDELSPSARFPAAGELRLPRTSDLPSVKSRRRPPTLDAAKAIPVLDSSHAGAARTDVFPRNDTARGPRDFHIDAARDLRTPALGADVEHAEALDALRERSSSPRIAPRSHVVPEGNSHRQDAAPGRHRTIPKLELDAPATIGADAARTVMESNTLERFKSRRERAASESLRQEDIGANLSGAARLGSGRATFSNRHAASDNNVQESPVVRGALRHSNRAENIAPRERRITTDGATRALRSRMELRNDNAAAARGSGGDHVKGGRTKN